MCVNDVYVHVVIVVRQWGIGATTEQQHLQMCKTPAKQKHFGQNLSKCSTATSLIVSQTIQIASATLLSALSYSQLIFTDK